MTSRQELLSFPKFQATSNQKVGRTAQLSLTPVKNEFRKKPSSKKKIKRSRSKHQIHNGKQFVQNLFKAFMVYHVSSGLTSPSLKDVRDLTSTSNLKTTRGLVRQVLGTQEPVFKLRSDISVIVSTAGSVINTVINMDVTGIHDWASWVSLFDEYQLLHAEFVGVPYQAVTPTTLGAANNDTTPAVVVVDYDNATALTSASDAIAYDSHKIWFFSKANTKLLKMKVQPQGIPDFTWYDTAAPVISSWIKMYGLANTAVASATLCAGYVEYTIRFRQIVA
jgi:hypothetical protein